ncbi:hypothetical protein DAKH74_033950 [Maudiozyma humilis]|uniref:protein-serine/threonine phosphatase n=1 Tax=Maudiozyma humilis TaxID=51915 RepID=A0AAV5S2C5_MAUHU|nr:hypothetical protein DAKH74_033950 [Kazachstania humilis]
MGQILSNPIIDKERGDASDSLTAYGVCSMQGWRTSMEDAHITEPRVLDHVSEDHLALYAVFDGHGGSNVARECSSSMCRTLRQLVHANDGGHPNYAQILINCFLEMDQDIREDPELTREPSGCTATTLLISKNQGLLVCANAGDSRTVLSLDGCAKALSFDHKPGMIAESSRIIAAGGWVDMDRVNGNLALSRAIGDYTYKNNRDLGPREQVVTALPDTIQHYINLDHDEFVILACDGIWDCLTSQECVDLVHYGINTCTMTLSDICSRIIDVCCAPTIEGSGIGCDNMSIEIVALLRDGETTNGWMERMRMRASNHSLSFEEMRKRIYNQYLPQDPSRIFEVTTDHGDGMHERDAVEQHDTAQYDPVSPVLSSATLGVIDSANNAPLIPPVHADVNKSAPPAQEDGGGGINLFSVEAMLEAGMQAQENANTAFNMKDRHSDGLSGMLHSLTSGVIGETGPYLSEEEEESERETRMASALSS